MTFWVTAWLRAFGLTLLIEIPIAAALLARVEPRVPRRAAAIAAANLATHPLVWFLFPGLMVGRTARLTLSEAWAVIIEAAIYVIVWPALRCRRALLISLAANLASALVGLALGSV